MTRNQTGFTLIEVLIAAVVIGILAAVAVPLYAGSKEKAYLAVMKADLHTLAMYEEQFAADNHGQYFSGTATADAPLNGFAPSKDVTVTLTAFNILGSQLADIVRLDVRRVQRVDVAPQRAGEDRVEGEEDRHPAYAARLSERRQHHQSDS